MVWRCKGVQSLYTAESQNSVCEWFATRSRCTGVQGLHERLTKARSNGVTTEQLEEVQAEAAAMKRIILCSVCNKRPKTVVISKCWHMFCKECIESRMSSRSRKCPTCSTAFGAADVHEVFL